MKTVIGVALSLLLLSCGGPADKPHGWQPLHGSQHVTPKYGLTFYWVGAAGAYQTMEEAAKAIDAAYFEWQGLYEAKWGYAIDRFRRQQAIQRISIQLFASSAIIGNTSDWSVDTLGIYWPWQHQVDVAMAAPLHWDAGMECWSEGLQVLRHEWSHVLQGAYHP